ncbi:hypothetical protein GCM10023318_38900 [Nocardia callitridis]|uniref:Sensor domain-containing protein n=1 Tax=Nocardia callitridis TaxID=648753 RepID=A0ABP9KKK6_9NOCA
MLALASTLLVAGCGGSDSGQPPAEQPELPPLGPVVAAAPVTGAPITDRGRLDALLLGPDVLPPNFTALPPRNDGQQGTGAAAGEAPTDPAECAAVLTPVGTQHAGALTQSSAQYEGPNFASIDIDAASFANDVAAQAFTGVQEVLRRCARYSSTDSSQAGIDYRVGGLAQPPAGDASAAFQVRTTSDGLTLESSVALVQVGSTLAQVSVTAPESVDPGVLTDLTAAQVRELQGPEAR